MSGNSDPPPSRSQTGVLCVFGFTVFLSAALLFLIQLMFARMLLPMLGGTPSVWNTSMVFYQAVLLAAYGYGHVISTRLPLRVQAAVHAIVLLVPFLVLPPAIGTGWNPPADRDPALWVLGILAVGAGLPFFAVATTSPLLQKWFAAAGHARSGDPYFLYAASNAGSLAGLLAYPFFIERTATLGQQSTGWTIAYGVTVAATLAAVFCVIRNPALRAAPQRGPAAGKPPAIPWKRRLRWIACAAIPSSLMLSVTSYISNDLGSMPLIWVVPLALYLVTFILAFSGREAGKEDSTRRIGPLLLFAVSVTIAAGFDSPLLVMATLHLLAFFVLAFICHRKAAQDRPAPENLTVFYFCLSLGGLAGGVFNSLLAPRIFNGILEYHLTLIAFAALAGASAAIPGGPTRTISKLHWALGLIAILAWSVFNSYLEAPALKFLTVALPAVGFFLLSRRTAGVVLATACILLPSWFFVSGRMALLHSERSYFGIHRVYQREGGFHWLIHGTTLHGVQNLNPDRRRSPLGYYHPQGPLGSVFGLLGASLNGPIAVAGLGTGGIAAYGKPQQEMTFFEIDPVVERIARNPAWFTYLQDSPAKVNVVTGDARLSLKSAPDAHYQLIILDAYTSDAIPVHLLTREAVSLYLSKLRPDGVLLFHLSNLHFDLRPLGTALFRDANLLSLFAEDEGPEEPSVNCEHIPSRWIAAAREEHTLAPLEKSGNWVRDPSTESIRVWTDDYSSPLELLKNPLKRDPGSP